MTTIVYKDGFFAADSLQTANDVRFCERNKIIDLGKGNYFMGVGVVTQTLKMADEIKKKGLFKIEYVMEDSANYLIWWKGELYLLDNRNHPMPLNQNKFYACGSGYELALGAMEMGATAAEAVRVAIKFDVGSGGDVNVKYLK